MLQENFVAGFCEETGAVTTTAKPVVVVVRELSTVFI